MSLWPAASQTRTPLGIGIIAAQARRPAQQPVPAPCLPAAAEAGRCAIPPQPSEGWQRRPGAAPRRRAPSLPRPEQSDIRPQLQPQASRSKARGVLAAATHEVGWDECRAGAPFLPPPPRAPGTPPQSAASQSTSTAVAAPDRTAPSPSSRLPINLQINEQSSHVGTRSDRLPSPDAYPLSTVAG